MVVSRVSLSRQSDWGDCTAVWPGIAACESKSRVRRLHSIPILELHALFLYKQEQVFMNWAYVDMFRQLFVPSGGLEYKKDGGARRKLWKEPLGGTKILFCGRGLKFFLLVEVLVLTWPIISCHIFSAQYPKRAKRDHKSSRGAKTAF